MEKPKVLIVDDQASVREGLRTVLELEDLEVVCLGGRGSGDVKVRSKADQYDFSHPYYWAALVLIGNPD